jgi:hypothetical protein
MVQIPTFRTPAFCVFSVRNKKPGEQGWSHAGRVARMETYLEPPRILILLLVLMLHHLLRRGNQNRSGESEH